MSDTSSPPFKLVKPLGEDLLRVIRALKAAADTFGTPLLLVGAAARDLVLVNLWGRPPGRATKDLDFAFAVDDWRHFEQLRDSVVATGRFARDARQAQRLLYTDPDYGFRFPVDFIPFGGVASKAQTIAWPPDGDFVMNISGFAAAFSAALRIELEPSLVLAVASLPGLAILKTIAWADRHMFNNKDAADLYLLLTTYELAGNEERLFGEEFELLESVGYELTLAGARLLGRDAARVADREASKQIGKLLASEAKMDLLVSQMVTTASYEENTGAIIQMVENFRQGFLAEQRYR